MPRGVRVCDASVLGIACAFSALIGTTTAVSAAKTPLTTAIGDRIWADVNGNGLQDAGETGINGITVRFVQGTKELASTVTSNGPTDGAPGWYQLPGLPVGVTGKIVLDRVQDYLPGGALVARVLTPVGVGTDRDRDSNGAQPGYGFVQIEPVKARASGESNGSYDIGFAPASALVNQIWYDANSNGRHDAEEPGIDGVAVAIYGAASNQLLGQTHSATDPADSSRQGICFFDGLPTDVPWRIELADPTDFANGAPLDGLILTEAHAPQTLDTNDSDALNIGGIATVAEVSSTGNYSLNFSGDFGFRPLRKGERQPPVMPKSKATNTAPTTAPTTTTTTTKPTAKPVGSDNDPISTELPTTKTVDVNPNTTDTRVKLAGRQVIHDHSLILALATDSTVPESVAAADDAAVAGRARTSASAVDHVVAAPAAADSSTMALSGGALLLLGLIGLVIARRFT